MTASDRLVAECIELLRNAEYQDGQATVLTHDLEAIQRLVLEKEGKYDKWLYSKTSSTLIFDGETVAEVFEVAEKWATSIGSHNPHRDRETAKAAVIAELLRRNKAELVALEDLQ